MAAISSTAGSQSVAQSALQELRIQQARQNAGRAEQVARSLRQQAVEAQRDADRADENARSLSVQSDQAAAVAGRARQGLEAIRSAGEMQARLSQTVGRINELPDSSVPVADVSGDVGPAPVPVVNTSGQITGTLVNTTA
jgi:methyl-accepting chemotaxis protein